ncbi:MAG TPA: lysophospholipid acyltransferase family protein [Gemmatimonadaceae bacterium]|jgi:1-acyl-sn-glycerol-3-phosphate acyltransferase
MMRIILVAIVGLTMTAVLAPVVIVARLLGRKEGPRSIYAWATRTWARSVLRAAGARARLHNPELISSEKGAVYISNHVSWFDVFVLAAELPRYSFIAKSELRKIPLFGYGAEAAGIVFLDRDNRKAAFESYKLAAKEVERGRSIVVFPEGTRGYDYHLRPFKKGPFVLAIASQCPIIPTIVHGSREVMAKGSFLVRRGDIDVHFLDPIETKGLTYDDRAELMMRVWTRMANSMRDLYSIGTDEYPIAEVGERSA